MDDDHGTLRDEAGRPKVYKPLGPDSVPLAEAMIWPDDMTDWEAVRYAADIEFGRATPGPLMSRRWRCVGLRGCIPLGACRDDHTADECLTCGAAK